MSKLHEAAAEGNLALVKEYLKTDTDVNVRRRHTAPDALVIGLFYSIKALRFRTPLHIAAYHGHVDVVRTLVAAGAIIDLPDLKADGTDANTAFEIAIARQHYAVAKSLHSLGARDPKNLLQIAFEKGLVEHRVKKAISVKQTQVLIDAFAADLLPPALQVKLLFYAIEVNAIKIVMLMLDQGVSVKNSVNGKTVLQQALFYCNKRSGNAFYLKELFRHGAKITEVNGNDLLMFSKVGHVVELAVLIEQGIYPSICIDGKPFMEHCFQNNRYQLIHCLINAGADVHYINERGQNYLHRCKDILLASRFIALGIDIYLSDMSNRLPRDYASAEIAHLIDLRMQHSEMRVIEKCRFHKKESTVVVLKQLVIEANRMGGLNRLQQALQGSNGGLLNLACDKAQCTVLHEAFWNNQGFMQIESKKTYGEQLLETPHTQAIDLLISKGAWPQMNAKGQTPLMYLHVTRSNPNFIKTLILRYAPFEANFYNINYEDYGKALFQYYSRKYTNLYFPSLRSNANLIEIFWNTVQPQNMSTAATLS